MTCPDHFVTLQTEEIILELNHSNRYQRNQTSNNTNGRNKNTDQQNELSRIKVIDKIKLNRANMIIQRIFECIE